MSLSSYIEAALASARYKTLADRTCFGEIAACKGVWANATTMKRCKDELRDVLEDWIVLRLRSTEDLPAVHGKRLTVPQPARA